MKELIFIRNKHKARYMCDKMSRKHKCLCFVIVDYQSYVICTHRVYQEVYKEYIDSGAFAILYRKDYHHKLTKQESLIKAKEKNYIPIKLNGSYEIISQKCLDNNSKLKQYIVNE